jgi:ElaB/YqjD/DUF883 family membrane-anchored ribosome-binding protein
VTWPADSPAVARGDDAEIDEKVAGIEETREEMVETVDAISDRLRPENVIDDAKQTLRDATVGRVEEKVQTMTQTAERFTQDPAGTAQQVGAGLMDTIRQNPVPAVMAGVGLTWLFLSRNESRDPDRRRFGQYGADWSSRPASWQRASAADYGGSSTGIADRMGRTAEETTDRLGRTVDDARENVSQFMDDASRTVSRVPQEASFTARRLGDQAGRIVEENPLGIAVTALAVGTVIGMALPATEAEHRLVGQASEQLIDRAGQAATEGLRKVEESTTQPASGRTQTGTTSSASTPRTKTTRSKAGSEPTPTGA